MADRLSERDELTLRTLAYIERTTFAEQRRKALRAYAQRARRHKDVAGLVEIILASRKERRDREQGNVVPIRRRA
jgi:hypothetical protein